MKGQNGKKKWSCQFLQEEEGKNKKKRKERREEKGKKKKVKEKKSKWSGIENSKSEGRIMDFSQRNR